ncbi:major facilitator superfamily domain-containing protein 3-like [Ixodes scapularis]|uniref:major facilitator superfamily domain-containing protein 3-like n=1 Tax=Ixodes scapularis TaxID=6945 RepID=UPI001C381DED|nr:major facilitator superfamily domain-containing protein 3-like [Ixodes scapularis]
MGSIVDSFFMYAYLAVLYFVQGVPYGVQDKLLPQYHRSARFPYSQVTLARILLLPWLCKPLYASYIEKHWTQKRWLQLFLLILMAVTWVMSYFGDQVSYFIVTLLILNIVSASLDISVDGVAMDVLHGAQLSVGNAVQVGAYKAGAIFGGGLLLALQFLAGLKGVLRGLTFVYAIGLIAVTFRSDGEESQEEADSSAAEATGEAAGNDGVEGLRRRKRDPESLKTGTAKEAKEDDTVESTGPLPESFFGKVKWVLSVEGTMGLLVFLLFYKSGEYGILTTYPSFLLERGYSYFTVGFLNGVFAEVLSVFGSLLGGYMSRQTRDNTKLLLKMCFVRVLPAALIFLTNTRLFGKPSNVYVGVSSMLFLNFISGMITTVVFTIMMRRSQQVAKGYKTTHFSFLCTVEVLGKLAFSILVGPCIDLIGKPATYFVMTAFTAFSVATVKYVK